MRLSLEEIKRQYTTYRNKFRVGIYDPDEIFDLTFASHEAGKRSLIILGNLPSIEKYYDKEVRVRLSKFYPSYYTFRKSQMCIRCGLRGRFIAAERDNKKTRNGNVNDLFHFNFYGINKDGQQILMTRDHIIPSAYGGPNRPWNFQTMCLPCNEKRAHTGNVPFSVMNRFIEHTRYNIKMRENKVKTEGTIK